MPEPKETAFLAALKADFEAKHKDGAIEHDKKGNVKTEDMSGLEDRVYKRLEKEAEKPGELSQDAITKAVTEEVDQAVLDAKKGTIKIENLVKVSLLNQGIGFLKREVNKNTNGVGGRTFTILENGVEKTINSAISEAQENTIKSEVNTATIVGFAKDAGLPEKSEPGLKETILKAAGSDLKIDSKELAGLIKDPKFQELAQKLGVSNKVAIHNDANDLKDSITLGEGATAKTFVLSEIDTKLRFTDDAHIEAPSAGKPAAPKGKGAGRH